MLERQTKQVRFGVLLAFLGLALFCVTLFWAVPHSRAAINPQINFQGKLTNPDGTNVTNGTYSIVFSMYSVATGGAAIWTETQSSVSVTDGIFQVALGSVTALPGSVDFNSGSIFLGVKVGADAEMTPRVQFTSAPYAFNSDKLGGIASTGFVQLSPGSQQTGNINISGSVTAGSSMSFSAASAASIQSASSQALNVTGNAASTFSTSAGQLTVQSGSGTLSLGSSTALTANAGLTISSATTNALTLDSGTTGGVNLGTNANAKTITIGNTTGATSIAHLVGGGTNVFNVQGASSAVYMQIDSTNSRLYVGNPAGDTSAMVLVLDNSGGTEPVSPPNGSMYYSTTSNKFRCYQNSAWVDCLSPWIQVKKTANQDVTNSATLVNDTDLNFPVAAGSNYVVRFYICYAGSSAAGDYKGQFTFPAATAAKNIVGRYTTTTIGDAIASSAGVLGNTATFNAFPNAALAMGTAAAATDRRIFEGYLSFQSGTAGTMNYKFAQNTATAATFARTCANSFLEYQAL
ncbi:MAG: hypothetical protein WAQ24_04790 [Candidatus Saccharimonadales bacterium]